MSPRPFELFRVDGSPYWYCYFLTREGHRFRKSTRESDKARAVAVAREWERQHADPTYSAAAATTLTDAGSLLAQHLDEKGRAPATREFYETKLSQVARLLGAKTPLANITRDSVRGYIRDRRSEGAERYTVAKELTALRMALKVSRAEGKFDRELSQVMPVGYDTAYVPRTHWLTVEQTWALIGELPPTVGRYAAFVCATTARDAAAHRALGKHRTEDGILVLDKKTEKATRVVPVIDGFNDGFADFAFHGVANNQAVAPGLGSVRHALRRATGRLGLPSTSPNDLRRSVAHWLHDRDVPINVAASFFGHASLRMMLEVYGQLSPKEIGAAIKRALTPRGGANQ